MRKTYPCLAPTEWLCSRRQRTYWLLPMDQQNTYWLLSRDQ
ncbi:hypothetical protein LEMLEM_LOCUS744 [Lemmus lemmus]